MHVHGAANGHTITVTDMLTLEYEYRELTLALAQHKAWRACPQCTMGMPCPVVDTLQQAATSNRDILTYLEMAQQE
jgi:hypothetical protein